MTAVQHWLNRWREVNNYAGPLSASSFESRVMWYTPEEYQRARIQLFPEPGRTIRWMPQQWQGALDRARIDMRLKKSIAANNPQQGAEKAQEDILTEGEKAADAVKGNARRAIGRRATILTTPPRGVMPLPSGGGVGGGLLSGTSVRNPIKTLLGQ